SDARASRRADRRARAAQRERVDFHAPRRVRFLPGDRVAPGALRGIDRPAGVVLAGEPGKTRYILAMRRPEVLAPAGDREAMRAAVRAGADAVYFGLQGFNARARATNFDAAELGATLAFLHENGVKGYVTLNTLVFDAELASVEAAI